MFSSLHFRQLLLVEISRLFGKVCVEDNFQIEWMQIQWDMVKMFYLQAQMPMHFIMMIFQ